MEVSVKKILSISMVILIMLGGGCAEDTAPNSVDAYKTVIDKLYNEDTGLNSNTKYIAIDTSAMVNLNDDAKTELLKQLENYGLELLDMTFDELEKQGYIQDLYFKEGILFKIEDTPLKNNVITMNVSKWRSGLGAIGYNNLVIKYNDGEWKITKLGEAWIS